MFRPVPDTKTVKPPEVGRVEFALRTALIFLQIAASYLLAEQVSPFFYQQF